MKNKNYIKGSMEDKFFDIINITLLLFVFFVVAYPLIIVISSSFSNPAAIASGKVWLFPVRFTLDGYKVMFHHKQVWQGTINSVFYTLAGTAINMVFTVLAAYPLSRKDFRLQKPIALIFAFTMWFSGGLIPIYLLVRDLNMYNTRWALLIPTSMSVWNVVIVRTYFQNSIPGELYESIKIDGGDDFAYLLKIAVPLAMPSLSVVCLYYMVGHWNNFFQAYIYLQDQALFPLQVVLREILLLSQMQEMSMDVLKSEGNTTQHMSELLKYSLIVFASLPMLLLYIGLQKNFRKGLMIGSVKG